MRQNNSKTWQILPAKKKIFKPNPAESGRNYRQIRQKVPTDLWPSQYAEESTVETSGYFVKIILNLPPKNFFEAESE